ncbi:sugar O-acetyltransferase [Uliginosibacterium gangwonense]|uniref:sugar O-acetyltransferase n=1 Tax=Uliginosibacterium gangwonense TaxID=392736 RepID=UPI00036B875C|nr:maltose acetyltransferase domain-containing protein [Uliginosibacterium gangwonense]
MRSEREKMLAGEAYSAIDPELMAARQRARRLCHELNAADADDQMRRKHIIRELFGAVSDRVFIQTPFHCDYGNNIYAGDLVFFNFNCVILDCAEVRIGNNVFIGPAVQIYTAEHPLDAAERATGKSSARPVEIGSDVWIGGGAIICPGIKIGNRSVIGAGSVVTHDVPEDVVVAGNPARVIRQLTK